jgi:hypothetical protein
MMVFAFLSQVGGGDNKFSCGEKLKLVEAGQRFANSTTLTSTGRYWVLV